VEVPLLPTLSEAVDELNDESPHRGPVLVGIVTEGID
jgi:hypothetical protein